MASRQPIARTVLAVLTAYSLVLHVLFMAMVAGPRMDAEASLMAQLQTICSGQVQVRGDLPADPGERRISPPCVLCGLGGGALDLPSTYVVAAPVNVVETVSAAAPPAPVREQRAGHPSQPRAPPVFS